MTTALGPKPRVTISQETTYLLGPLRADGYVDYVGALNAELGRGVTPENNAAVPLLAAVGPHGMPEKQREAFCEALGMPVPPEQGDYFAPFSDHVDGQLRSAEERAAAPLGSDESVKSDRFRKEWNDADSQLTQSLTRPWSEDDLPAIAGWLAANREPLRLIEEAASRPRWYLPLVPWRDPPMLASLDHLPILQPTADAARLLRARAMHRVGGGRLDEAWRDLQACHRLARHIARGPLLLAGFYPIPIEHMALRGGAAVAHHGNPTAAEIGQMRADLAALPPLPKVADRIDHGERFYSLDAVSTLARKGLPQIREFIGAAFTADKPRDPAEEASLARLDATIDWDEPLRVLNHWYDRLAAAARRPSRAERLAAMGDCGKDMRLLPAVSWEPESIVQQCVKKMPGREPSRWVADVLCAVLLTGVGRAALDIEDRTATEATLVDIALALAAYRADHGKYPERLADLRPRYRTEIKDPFSDGDLIYRPKGEGFLLYSVGPNGKDDGGRNRVDFLLDPSPPAGHEQWDDIAIHMPVRPPKH